MSRFSAAPPMTIPGYPPAGIVVLRDEEDSALVALRQRIAELQDESARLTAELTARRGVRLRELVTERSSFLRSLGICGEPEHADAGGTVYLCCKAAPCSLHVPRGVAS